MEFNANYSTSLNHLRPMSNSRIKKTRNAKSCWQGRVTKAWRGLWKTTLFCQWERIQWLHRSRNCRPLWVLWPVKLPYNPRGNQRDVFPLALLTGNNLSKEVIGWHSFLYNPKRKNVPLHSFMCRQNIDAFVVIVNFSAKTIPPIHWLQQATSSFCYSIGIRCFVSRLHCLSLCKLCRSLLRWRTVSWISMVVKNVRKGRPMWHSPPRKIVYTGRTKQNMYFLKF